MDDLNKTAGRLVPNEAQTMYMQEMDENSIKSEAMKRLVGTQSIQPNIQNSVDQT